VVQVSMKMNLKQKDINSGKSIDHFFSSIFYKEKFIDMKYEENKKKTGLSEGTKNLVGRLYARYEYRFRGYVW